MPWAALCAAAAIATQAAPALLPSTAAARARARGLVLHAASGRAAYAVGEQVRLNISLTNHTGRRIWLDDLADGTVRIERVTRRPPGRHARAVTVHPELSTIDFDEGLRGRLQRGLRRVAPGSTIHESESVGSDLRGPSPRRSAGHGHPCHESRCIR